MQQNNGKGMSIAALVLGIIACAFFWWPYVNIVTLILGVVGLILAIMGSKNAKAAGAPTGLATAGLVLSVIGVVLSAIGFFSCTLCLICACGTASSVSESDVNSALNDLQSYLS